LAARAGPSRCSWLSAMLSRRYRARSLALRIRRQNQAHPTRRAPFNGTPHWPHRRSLATKISERARAVGNTRVRAIALSSRSSPQLKPAANNRKRKTWRRGAPPRRIRRAMPPRPPRARESGGETVNAQVYYARAPQGFELQEPRRSLPSRRWLYSPQG
jgi:hypothetical protein